MDADTRLKNILGQALEIAAPSERKAFVERECAGDSSLRREITGLLAGAEKVRDFMAQPAGAALGSDPTVIASPARPQSGTSDIELVECIGDYELIQEIARGGMGVVYKARQISLNRIVALKMIRPGDLSIDAQETQRFRTEAEAAANLDHPNIVPLYEVGTQAGRHYFTMKLMEGGSLAARIAPLRRQPKTFARLLADVAHAVHYAHQRGILHRDLKPANILFDAAGVPHVTDFGLAKRLDQDANAGLTQSGAIMGTLEYMSPEQASGQAKRLTTAADTYSLGVILYELLAGEVPFKGESVLSVLMKVRNDEPALPRSRDRAVDRDLETICLKCLDKNPQKRYASAEAFALDLERWLRGEPIQARPTTVARRAIKWARRRPAAAASVALAAALVLAVGGSIWHAHDVTRNAEIEKLAEQERKAAEHRRKAEEWSAKGSAALAAAVKAGEVKNAAESARQFSAAEDSFRNALFENSANQAARAGLRDTALRHFQLALDERNWRQAEEKLSLAKGVELTQEEYDKDSALLAAKETERAHFIRKRVKELMDDAATLPRKVLHEMAVNELIALKDPLTTDLLLAYVDHEKPDCRKLAIGALTWHGDQKAVPKILPWIEEKTAQGADNPLDMQEAAVRAVCILAADDDMATAERMRARLWDETGFFGPTSLLYANVESYANAYTKRIAPRLENVLRQRVTPPSCNEWNHLGEIFKMGQDLKQALDCFEHAVKADPLNVMACINRGMAYNDSLKFKESIADYTRAIELDPRCMTAYNRRGTIKQSVSDWTGSIADFDKAIELDSRCFKAYSNRGFSKIKLGDNDGAIKDFNSALEIEPRAQTSYNGRAHAKRFKEDFVGALADIDKAIELNPRSDVFFITRATLKTYLKDWDGAIADYNRAFELDPRTVRSIYCRALAKQNKGDIPGAIADFEQVIRSGTDDAGDHLGSHHEVEMAKKALDAIRNGNKAMNKK